MRTERSSVAVESARPLLALVTVGLPEANQSFGSSTSPIGSGLLVRDGRAGSAGRLLVDDLPRLASATSSRHALCSLFIRAELNGKTGSARFDNVRPWALRRDWLHVDRDRATAAGARLFAPTLIGCHQSSNGNRTVTPAGLNLTSVPVVEDSLPAFVQVQVVLPGPTLLARNETVSPSVIVVVEAMMLHDTVGQGGSVTSNEAVQVDSPVVAQPDG